MQCAAEDAGKPCARDAVLDIAGVSELMRRAYCCEHTLKYVYMVMEAIERRSSSTGQSPVATAASR